MALPRWRSPLPTTVTCATVKPRRSDGVDRARPAISPACRLGAVRAHHVTVEYHFTKAPERVFAYLAEHEHLGELFGATVTRVRDGDGGERNGVGSRRRLQVGPLPPFEETVIEFVPAQRIAYRITKGSPLRGHLGTMSFAPTSGGTHLVYDIRLSSAVPGLAGLVAVMLTRSITRALPAVDRDA